MNTLTREELEKEKKKFIKERDLYMEKEYRDFNFKYNEARAKDICSICQKENIEHDGWSGHFIMDEAVRRRNNLIAECDRLILAYDKANLEWLRNYVLNIDDF